MVTQEKVGRVNAAMEKLEYHPNTLRKRSKTAPRLIMVITTNLIEEIYRGIQDAGRQLGYDVMTTYLYNEKDMDIFRLFDTGVFGGAVITNCRVFQRQLQELSSRHDLVECGNYQSFPNAFVISINDEKASCEMTAHLIRTGKRRIAFVGADDGIPFLAARKRGYLRAHYENGLAVDKSLLLGMEHTYQYGVQTAEFLLKRAERPDAVFCMSDIVAAGCLHRIKEEGVRVPGEIAVAGFDNMPLPGGETVGLTTVAQPFYDLGRESVQTLHAVLNGELSGGGRILLPHCLMVRGSTSAENDGGMPVE